MSRSLIGLADLATLVKRLDESEWRDAARSLGYRLPERAPPDVGGGVRPVAPAPRHVGSAAPASHGRAEPPRRVRYWRVAEVATSRPSAAPEWLERYAATPDAHFESGPQGEAPRVSPLIRRGELERFLRTQMSRDVASHEIDVQRLVKRVSGQQPIDRVPFLAVRRWPSRVRLVVDRADSLALVRADIDTIARVIGHMFGGGVTVEEVQFGTGGIEGSRNTRRARRAQDAALVVLGAAGTYSDDAEKAWWRTTFGVKGEGVRPLLLATAPWRLVDQAARRAFRVAVLDESRRIGLQSPSRGAGARWLELDRRGETGDRALRAIAAGVSYLPPAALRLMRQELQRMHVPVDLGTEIRFSLDRKHVATDGYSFSLRRGAVEEARRDLQEFRHLGQLAARDAAVACTWRALRVLTSPLVQATYALHLEGIAWQDGQLTATMDEASREARLLFAKVAARIHRNDQTAMGEALTAWVLRLAGRSRASIMASSELQMALVLAKRGSGMGEQVQGQDAPAPGWAVEEEPTSYVTITGAAGSGPPAQRGAVALSLVPAEAQPRCPFFPVVADRLEVTAQRSSSAAGDAEAARWPEDIRSLPQEHALVLESGCAYTIQAGRTRLTLDSTEIPPWADAVERSGADLDVIVGSHRLRWVPVADWYVDEPGHRALRLPQAGWWKATQKERTATRSGLLLKPTWAHSHGVDAHGWWAVLKVHGKGGAVAQRLRFLAPCSVAVGPDQPLVGVFRATRDHVRNVMLTTPIWLAETTCTRALWDSVIGASASSVPGQAAAQPAVVDAPAVLGRFLPALSAQVPGLHCELPTLIQWACAYRAATAADLAGRAAAAVSRDGVPGPGAGAMQGDVNWLGFGPGTGGEWCWDSVPAAAGLPDLLDIQCQSDLRKSLLCVQGVQGTDDGGSVPAAAGFRIAVAAGS